MFAVYDVKLGRLRIDPGHKAPKICRHLTVKITVGWPQSPRLAGLARW
jgi:hypothetical protein